MPPTDDPPQLSAASAPLSAEDETALQDELQVQEIMLESLDGTPEDTPDRRREIAAQTSAIRAKLRKFRAARSALQPGSTQSVSSASDYGGNGGYSGNSRSSSMTMYGGGSLGPSTVGGLPKKRSYDVHLGEDRCSTPDSKSRRTSPSPFTAGYTGGLEDFPANNSLFPTSLIDLTGDNEDQASYRQQQRETADRLRIRKRQEEDDAAFARQLQSGWDESYSSAPGPSQPGPSAFARLYNGSSQPALPSSYVDATESDPFASGSGTEDPTEPTRSPYRSPSFHRVGSAPGIPSHIKSESGQHGYHQPAAGNPTARSSTPARGSGSNLRRIPGSFPGDSADHLFSDGGMSGPVPELSPGASHTSVAAPPGELARRAALRRQQELRSASGIDGSGGPGYGNAGPSPYPVNSPNAIPSSGAPYSWPAMLARPGFLVNGSSIPFDGGSRSVYGSSGSSGLNDDLASIISRHTGWDHVNGFDANGNELPQHIRDLFSDITSDPKKSSEEIKELLANIRPDMEIPEKDREGTPEGLRTPLYPHQRLALTWTKSMEEDKNKKGGILADDMGLGKTISMLALMLSRPPEGASGSRRPNTNLIVGPVALMRQWQREIKTKINRGHELKVFMLHGAGAKKKSWDDISRFDVVLTTYGTLASELKKRDEYYKTMTREGGNVDKEHLKKVFPTLGPDSLFYRVILDEAQCIKNKNTLSAKAAYELQSNYRWCLSGTPMMNSVSELASLVHFLRIKPYDDFKKFQQHFGCLNARRNTGSSSPQAMRRLQALLKAVMLRRTKSSKIDGEPILRLPEKIEEVNHVVFSEDEQSYYDDLQNHSQVQFNKYLKAGTIGKHYSQILVLLLRLRQACCHPLLHITDLDTVNVEMTEDAMIDLAKSLSPSVIKRLKEAEGFECPICYDATENPSIMLPCGHDTCPECFVCLTSNGRQSNIQAGTESGNMVCPECRGPVSPDKVITYAIFKQVHMPETVPAKPAVVKEETDSGSSESDSDLDDLDDSDYSDEADERGNLKGFIVDDSEEDDGGSTDRDDGSRDGVYDTRGRAAAVKVEGARTSRTMTDASNCSLGGLEALTRGNQSKSTGSEHSRRDKKAKRSKKSKGKKKEGQLKPEMLKALRKDAAKNKEAYKRYMRYLKKIWEPSAKVEKAKEVVAQIQETGEKTIIFSQWTLLLDLLEVPIRNELRVGFRRYDGGMSATQRDRAANDFMERDDVRVILVSLRAGNAGLNLTAASHIIIMDPFWNPYTEMQAVDRAHRIGQRREVRVHRILTRGTVEDRIVDLQQKKRELVDAALDEGAARDVGRLSARELAYIFGVAPD